MKKAIILSIGIATMLSMTACSSINSIAETVAPEAANATQTEIVVTTTLPETVKEEKAALEIKVTDAVNKPFAIAGETFNYKIPRVTISGVNTDNANAAIKAEIEKDFNNDEEKAFDSNYEYFVGNKAVSIIVSNMDLQGGEFIYVKAYNVDINTGKLLTANEVVKLSGMTDEEFFGKVKDLYTEFDKNEIKKCGTNSEKNYIKENINKISYKFVLPYIGENGKLCFVGDVNCTGGAGVSFERFEVV